LANCNTAPRCNLAPRLPGSRPNTVALPVVGAGKPSRMPTADRLARSVRPEQGHQFPRRNGQVDSAQRLYRSVPFGDAA
jgi:hypothetical protein